MKLFMGLMLLIDCGFCVMNVANARSNKFVCNGMQNMLETDILYVSLSGVIISLMNEAAKRGLINVIMQMRLDV